MRTRHLLITWGMLLGTAAVGAGQESALSLRERRCEVGRARTVYAMIETQGACLRRCETRDASGASCVPPDGVGVVACLDAVKAQVRRVLFGRSCRRDCPPCYAGCGADVAEGEVGYTSGLVACFAGLVYCEPAIDQATARCMDGVARAAASFARRYGGCFARSQATGGDGSGPGDSRTKHCVARAETKTRATIDARCARAMPACHGGRTADDWLGLVRAGVDAGRPTLFCGSPAPAFVDDEGVE